MLWNSMNIFQILVSFLLGEGIATVSVFAYPFADLCMRSLEVSSDWSSIGNQLASNEMAFCDEVHQKEVSTKGLANSSIGVHQECLPQLLRKAAMDDTTVIMTVVNDACAAPNSLLDIFLESFRASDQIEHLLEHLIIVAVDPSACDRCKLVHRFSYFLHVDGVNFTSEQIFMSKDYITMMWSRNKFQRRILELGYNFLFTDVDILWFPNPLWHISVGAHMTFASDVFDGNANSLANIANGGFLYAKSSNKPSNSLRPGT